MKNILLLSLLFSFNYLFASSPDIKKFLNDNPKQILMVGNSFIYFNNGMHNPLVRMIRADKDLGEGHKIRKATINGSSLTWHNIKTYVSNPFIGSFTFDQDNNLVESKKEPFEVVIMHDCSRCPVNKKTQKMFHAAVDVHTKALKKDKIEVMLMMTWPYKDKPGMTKKLRKEYVKAANRNKIMVSPVGLAFHEVNKNYPDINLYTKDLRHPSPAGTYLAASVLFASIYKKTPEGNSFTFGLDAEKAKTLQKIAWQVTQNFYNGK
tara:strand:- start:42 stop:833 length:792 start_codon:yes stop_codon:yes gene_type:complete